MKINSGQSFQGLWSVYKSDNGKHDIHAVYHPFKDESPSTINTSMNYAKENMLSIPTFTKESTVVIGKKLDITTAQFKEYEKTCQTLAEFEHKGDFVFDDEQTADRLRKLFGYIT